MWVIDIRSEHLMDWLDYQVNWRVWYWPWHHWSWDDYYAVKSHYAGIGPIQFHWYSS